MSIEIGCDDCGKRLRLPDKLRGRKAKCPHCGGALETNTTGVAPQQAVAANAPDAGVELIDDLESTCPHCDGPMTEGAVLCVECGYNAKTGKRLNTVVKRYKRHWESDFPLLARALLCLAAAAGGLALFGVLALQFNPFLFLLALPWTAVSILNFGDFRSVDVERTRKGKLLVTAYSYIAFIPAGAKTVDAAHCNAIVLDYSIDINYTLIAIFVVMCLLAPPLALIRLIRLLYQMQGRQESVRVTLRGFRPRDDLLIYKGSNQDKMREIVDAVQEVANLSLERR